MQFTIFIRCREFLGSMYHRYEAKCGGRYFIGDVFQSGTSSSPWTMGKFCTNMVFRALSGKRPGDIFMLCRATIAYQIQRAASSIHQCWTVYGTFLQDTGRPDYYRHTSISSAPVRGNVLNARHRPPGIRSISQDKSQSVISSGFMESCTTSEPRFQRVTSTQHVFQTPKRHPCQTALRVVSPCQIIRIFPPASVQANRFFQVHRMESKLKMRSVLQRHLQSTLLCERPQFGHLHADGPVVKAGRRPSTCITCFNGSIEPGFPTSHFMKFIKNDHRSLPVPAFFPE